MALVRQSLEALIPEPLDRVLEREAQEKDDAEDRLDEGPDHLVLSTSSWRRLNVLAAARHERAYLIAGAVLEAALTDLVSDEELDEFLQRHGVREGRERMASGEVVTVER